MMEDTDGMAHVETDEVLLTGLTAATVDIDVHIESTGWEANDSIRVWAVDTAGNPPMDDIVLLDANDVDADASENSWVHYIADISGFTSVTVMMAMSSNSGAEEVWFDNVVIAGSGRTASGETPHPLNCEDKVMVTLGYTSFEEPVIAASKAAGKYFDHWCTVADGQDSVCDIEHNLVNNAGQNPVVYAGGIEMGFTARYTAGRKR
jgi:hypothetical protein